jgi:hypothetical protein
MRLRIVLGRLMMSTEPSLCIGGAVMSIQVVDIRNCKSCRSCALVFRIGCDS